MAENSCKADQYVGIDEASGCGVLILARALLGSAAAIEEKRSDEDKDFRLAPLLPDSSSSSSPPRRATSLVGSRRHRNELGEVLGVYREFVLFDGNLCYPEFLVTFHRVDQPNPA